MNDLYEHDGTRYSGDKVETDGKKFWFKKDAYCSKCGGAGYGPWFPDGGICYQCNGTGGHYLKVTRLYNQEQIDKINARREAKAAKYLADKEARREAARAPFMALHGELYERALRVQDDNDFVRQIAYRASLAWKLTDNELAALERAVTRAEEVRARPPASDAPEGKATVTGKVLSTKVQQSMYGSSLKMLVELDDFSKAWGSVPQKLCDLLGNDGLLVGARFTFTADFTRSGDDAKFAFFKRPTKIELIDFQKRSA